MEDLEDKLLKEKRRTKMLKFNLDIREEQLDDLIK